MSALKRFAFVAGFILGLAGFVLVAGNILLYLLTGRMPSVEIKEDGRFAFVLVSPQQVVNMVKEQVEKEREKSLGARLETDEPQ